MISEMQNIKPLHISKTEEYKGVTIFCNYCKRDVSEICKETGKSLQRCQHGDKHVFKVYVHVAGTKNDRKTKKLETRDISEAIKLAIDFEREVKEGIHDKQDKGKKKEIKNVEEIVPKLLVNAFARYIGWLHNEGVAPHRIKERSLPHILDVQRALKTIMEGLSLSGRDTKTISIDDINDNLVGEIFSYLEERGFANRTFNKYFGYYTSFLKWYAEEYNYPIRNWFERVKRKKLNPNPEAITREEYEALLKQITLENGVRNYENKEKPTRNVYRSWLADGIHLALETGRRREEITNLRWDQIEESEGVSYIKIEDFKVNRIQGRKTESEKKYNFIPVTDSLRALLDKMNKNNSTSGFILAPEINISRKRVMSDILSRGFSHYYDQLNTGRHLTFKCLRKTYITNLQLYMRGGDIKAITGHSEGSNVIEANYIDKKEIAKAGKNFSVFPNEERSQELKKIRTKKQSKTKNQEVEK